jgi:hypothetical protein
MHERSSMTMNDDAFACAIDRFKRSFESGMAGWTHGIAWHGITWQD